MRVHRVAEQPGLARARRQQAGEHFHGGGLAAAVGAEEAEDLAAADAETHPVHGGEIAETPGQVAGLDGHLGVRVRGQWREGHGPVAAPPLLGQQADEGRLERVRAGACAQFGGRACCQETAAVHGHQPVEPARLLHVGGGHEHAHPRPARADAVDQVPELAAGERVHAGGGFVEDEQVRVVDEGAAEAELLPHAAGELARRPVEEGRKAGGRGQLVDAPVPLGRVVAEQVAEEMQIFRHRQGRVEIFAEPLGHVGNVRADLVPVTGRGHVAAEHLDPAGLDAARPGRQGEQARFAHPVRADQADHAAGGHLQVDPVQGQGGAVAQADPGQADNDRCPVTAVHGHPLTAAGPAVRPATRPRRRRARRPCRAGRS